MHHMKKKTCSRHTHTHTNPAVFIFKWKFLSFKLRLFPSFAFNACWRGWKVSEQRERERERILVGSEASSHPFYNFPAKKKKWQTERRRTNLVCGPVSHTHHSCQNITLEGKNGERKSDQERKRERESEIKRSLRAAERGRDPLLSVLNKTLVCFGGQLKLTEILQFWPIGLTLQTHLVIQCSHNSGPSGCTHNTILATIFVAFFTRRK